MASSPGPTEVTVLQTQLITQFGALELAANPYLNSRLRLTPDEYLSHASPHHASARVFYLTSYIQPAQLSRLLTHVPYICIDGDRQITTQRLTQHSSLADALAEEPDLVSTQERRLSRHKSVASFVTVFATGGFHAPLCLLDRARYFECVVVSGAGPQFEARYLDYADLIVERGPKGPSDEAETRIARLPAFDDTDLGPIPKRWNDVRRLSETDTQVLLRRAVHRAPFATSMPSSASGPGAERGSSHATSQSTDDTYARLAHHLPPLPAFYSLGSSPLALHVSGYVASLRACIRLWLVAFDTLVAARRPKRCGYFKMTAIGTGFFADVAEPPAGLTLRAVLPSLVLRAALEVLADEAAQVATGEPAAFAHILAIEFPDFTADRTFSPPKTLRKIGAIQLIAAPKRDVLDFAAMREGPTAERNAAEQILHELPDGVALEELIPGVLNPGDCFALVGNETGYGSVEAMIGCNTTVRLNQNYVWNCGILDKAKAVGVDLDVLGGKERGWPWRRRVGLQ